MIYPTSITKIDATNKRISLIDDDELLVMSPKELKHSNVIGMAKEFYVLMLNELLLAVVAVDAQRHFHFFIQEDENLHALFLKEILGILRKFLIHFHSQLFSTKFDRVSSSRHP